MTQTITDKGLTKEFGFKKYANNKVEFLGANENWGSGKTFTLDVLAQYLLLSAVATKRKGV